MLKDLDHLLEQIPLWKRLKAIPDEFEKLKLRVAQLETQLKAVGERCPKCGHLTWFVDRSEADKVFGDLGGVRRHYRCRECGYEESKIAE